jgi:two-component sensor histidine kinase
VRRSPLGVGTVVALSVAALAYVSDLIVLSMHYWPALALVDALILGLLCGAIAWAYQGLRNRFLRERLHIIAEMNHRVRNELQVIRFSAYLTQDKEHIDRIENCVQHIDVALREVLPGKDLQAANPESRIAQS